MAPRGSGGGVFFGGESDTIIAINLHRTLKNETVKNNHIESAVSEILGYRHTHTHRSCYYKRIVLIMIYKKREV